MLVSLLCHLVDAEEAAEELEGRRMTTILTSLLQFLVLLIHLYLLVLLLLLVWQGLTDLAEQHAGAFVHQVIPSL